MGEIAFDVLGPLRVTAGTEDRTPRRAKVRALLALLIVHAGEVVSLSTLIDELWGEDPPATAHTALQVYVSQLRRALCPGVPPGDPDQLLQTRRPGYLLRLDPTCCDLHRFGALAERGDARLAAGDHPGAVTAFDEALALWRGPALADVVTRVVHDLHAPALEEQRLSAIEHRATAQLALGRPETVATELAGPVDAHPLRERLAAQLMTALHRSGRRCEAMAVFDRVRRVLADEVGIDPGPELRAVRAAIGAGPRPPGSPAPTGPPPAPDPHGRPEPVPAQLPPPIPDFTGRRDAAAAVAAALLDDAEHGGAPACCEITGPGGAGKTTLAVQTAHRVQHRFADGVLMADLRGTGECPADPADVLDAFLRALGVDGRFVPDSPEDRSRLFRSRIAGRSVLVVLDDAASEQQVRPLLPGTSGCAVLITGRVRLLGLEGVHTVGLDALGPDESTALLERLVGRPRVAAEPAAAADIVRLCGHLPLAVRIVGARLSAKAHWTLADFAASLADERRRLDMLAAGDLEVRTSIGTSYRGCSARDRLALRLLARLDLPDFPAWLVAALLDDDVRPGTDTVERLVDAHLVHVRGIDRLGQVRYGLHDLVRLYAVERTAGDPPVEWHQALGRVVGALVELLVRAERAVHPGGSPDAGHPALAWSVDDGVAATVDTDPLGWSTVELPVLVGVLQRTHAAALWPATCRLAGRLAWIVDVLSDWSVWRLAQELGLDAARRAGDPAEEAAALRRRGDLEWDLGRARRAVADYTRSRCLRRRAGDRHGAARAALGLAAVYADRGPLRRAAQLMTEAGAVFAEVGDRRGQAQLARHRGLLHRDRGELDEAAGCLQSAAAIFEELGDRRWRAYVLRSLVGVRREQGRLDEAEQLAESCHAAFRAVSDLRWETYALFSLAEIDRDRGRWTSAAHRFGRCTTRFEGVGDRRAAALTHCRLGEVRQAEGRVAEAIRLIRRGREQFAEIDESRGMAIADLALGRAHRAAGQEESAARCFRGASDRFGRIGLTERAEEARAQLQQVPDAGSAGRAVPSVRFNRALGRTG